MAERMARAPVRIQLKYKDPKSWRERGGARTTHLARADGEPSGTASTADEPGVQASSSVDDASAHVVAVTDDVILTAVGFNLRRVLAWLRAFLASILIACWRTAIISPAFKPAS
jgi:hypothetical protein